MTIRNLDALFAPKSIALIGASNTPSSVGNVLARNLLSGGFLGPVMPVNPHETTIAGFRSFTSIAGLPAGPDLAVIATPAKTVPGVIKQLADCGCRAAIVISAGFDGPGRLAVLEAARPTLMRIIGPNCLGFLSPGRGINASFSHLAPLKGDLALITQSGAIATSLIDWTVGRGIGFSHLISLGDMSDVDLGDLLDYVALDQDTSAILLYAETITHARKFMSAARIAARTKPVIIMKSGRSLSGARAAASHTGALAGSDAVYDAAFRRAGMLRVETLRHLFDAAASLASGLQLKSDRLTILTNGGGLGVIAADALEQGGGVLAELDAATGERLGDLLPSGWSHANPIDILGDAGGKRYEKTLRVLTDSRSACGDTLLVMNCPTGVADAEEAARAVTRVYQDLPERAIIGCWMGETSARRSRDVLDRAGVPNYETPEEAIAAFLHLSEYAKNQASLLEAPAAARTAPERSAAVRAIISGVIADGRLVLTEAEAKDVLDAYNIPAVRTHIAATPQEAGRIAASIGKPVALKVLSRDISHKSDVGGVRLDLPGPDDVIAAAGDMLTRVREKRPDAVIDGFTVQEMVKRPMAHELLVGCAPDPVFGPCLLFGHGGIAAEIISDRCMGLPPLNACLAQDMIRRTRISRLLGGYRDRPPANLSAVADVLVSLSDLVVDFPEIAELDINPLLADAEGVIALDARIILRAPQQPAAPFAILPYPKRLVSTATAGGQPVGIRPVRPDDTGRLYQFARQIRPEDMRLHFCGEAVPAMTWAARMSQIDYDRQMVLVADLADGSTGGLVSLMFDPDFTKASCMLMVRPDLDIPQLEDLLMPPLLAYVHARGAAYVRGDIPLRSGQTPAWAVGPGICARIDPGAPGRLHIDLSLGDSRPAPARPP